MNNPNNSTIAKSGKKKKKILSIIGKKNCLSKGKTVLKICKYFREKCMKVLRI